MTVFPDVPGVWHGRSGFRLMPTDPFHEAPAGARVVLGAAGHLASVTYTWQHPDDGPQDGMLTVGATDENTRLTALWADSWHQQPAPLLMHGTPGPHGIDVEGEYAEGWIWRIEVDAGEPGTLRIRMDNDIPSGRYRVMEATLTPS
ncbi:hypothetical protein ABZX65_16145 [Streptomyces sp. NPDC003300]|uniref:hypothetical protein n=1 Tax=unclassified Streptomyces TaxID=2593676 RepID=UPI0033BB1165